MCPKCHRNVRLTRHHILPKRFFKGSGDRILICRLCHDELELRIPQKTKLTEEEYYQILYKFLKEDKNEEMDTRGGEITPPI